MTIRPPVWEMIREAVNSLPGSVFTYAQIKEYIRSKYRDVNETTVNSQIVICTVNQPSRIHYPENQKPRQATSKYDFLYSIGRGTVVQYDPAQHGLWEIAHDESGKLYVAQVDVSEPFNTPQIHDQNDEATTEQSLSFPFESHLRDFIVKNLNSLRIEGKKLSLFVDDKGVSGVEYRTAVGVIDILTVDDDGHFVVFELKLSKGEDRTLGQILRYMGWIQQTMSISQEVRGVIVAHAISDELRYAVSITPSITLFEYEVSFIIKPISIPKRSS